MTVAAKHQVLLLPVACLSPGTSARLQGNTLHCALAEHYFIDHKAPTSCSIAE